MVIRSPCLILLLLFAMVAAATAQQRKSDTLIIHFAFDRSVVNVTDATMIREYFLHQHADSVLVIGYTDTVGTEDYNLRLSRRRADAVAMNMANSSPQESRNIRTEAHGETEALPGDDSLSRRAVVIVFAHTEPPPPPIADAPVRRAEGEPDTTIAMHNINFVANTAILTDAARLVLPRSVPMLRQMSDRYLEIDGYCNQPGPLLPKTDPLFILSVQRAKYIYDYLISQGFDSTHLSYKGMGNASPKNEHPVTKADMDENMRVEIRVFRTAPPVQ